MQPWQKLVIAFLAASCIAMGVFGAGFWLGSRGRTIAFGGSGLEGRGSRLIDEAYNRIRNEAVEPPAEEVLARGAIKGMVRALKSSGDPYAFFYNSRDFQSFQELTTGRLSGIGVWLDPRNGKLEVLSVLPKSPALGAGIRPGDVIVTVDGDEVADMTLDEATGRIKGPAGTEVSLVVRRDGEEIDFEIERASIAFPNLRASLRADDLAYIQLVSFARGAGDQLRDKVDSFVSQGAEGVVLDLRDNGGGLFTEAVEVASVFIEDGVISTYVSPAEKDVDYDAEGEAFEDIPLVVLVNGRTASASEIVAGALQDRDRAIVVGSTTFGKGSVQEVIPLPGASAIKLTTAAYLTPDGSDINGQGIEPDVEVSGDQPVAQKSRAVEILKGIVLSGSGGQG